VYVPGEWKRRGRVDPRSKSSKIGRPVEKFKWVADPGERLRCVDRARKNSPAVVTRKWRHEAMRRCAAEVMAESSCHAYVEWFDALDDEPLPGVDLTHSLWGAFPACRPDHR
jgi:hypothetical protein